MILSHPLLKTRLVFLYIFVGCAFLMATGILYFERTLGLEACPLCMTQRLFIVLCGLWGLLAFVHNPGVLGVKVYSFLCALSAILGGAISGRQLWLQSLPPDQAPACGPSLAYMFESFPLSEAFQLLMLGDGNCAETVWSLWGLSIPGWTLVAFTGLLLIAGFQFFRR